MQIQSRARAGLIAITLLVVGLWKPWLHWLVAATAAFLGVMGVREFFRMGRSVDMRAPFIYGAASVLAILAVGTAPAQLFTSLMVTVVSVVLLGSFVVYMAVHGPDGAYRAVPVTTFAPLYVGLPLAMSLQILALDRMLLMFGLAIIWLSDSGAYFAGRRFGRHPMAPRLSPKKTVEGAIGGIVSCVLIAVLFKALVPAVAFTYTWLEVLTIALILGIVAPIGDLAESVLKRDTGVKDSGRGMGGHGGVLDRLDSMFFCLPALYIFLQVTGRIPH